MKVSNTYSLDLVIPPDSKGYVQVTNHYEMLLPLTVFITPEIVNNNVPLENLFKEHIHFASIRRDMK